MNLTNTINQDLFNSNNNDLAEIADLKSEDYDELKQIMNEIVEFKNSSEELVVSNINHKNNNDQKLNRLDSIQIALGDYCLNEFENFESNIQLNGDPMFGNMISNIIQ